MYGLSPVSNATVSVVPFTTDLMVGVFGPTTCSGYGWLIEVLQYTVYPVMTPFLGMGTDQLAESQVGEPRTGDSMKFEGEEGTEGVNNNIIFQNGIVYIEVWLSVCNVVPFLK